MLHANTKVTYPKDQSITLIPAKPGYSIFIKSIEDGTLTYDYVKDEKMTDATQTPIVQAAEAVAATIANPSLPVLAEDLVLVHSLVSDVKAKLAGKHPSLTLIFHALFNIG